MLCVQQNLLSRFVVGVLAVVKRLAITDQQRHRHKDSIEPGLPLSSASVPESAVFRSRISIKAFANLSCRALVALIFRFPIENDEEISRHHGIQVIEAVVELAVGVDVGIYPTLNESEVSRISGARVDEVFSI